MSARANFVKNELEKINDLLDESYEYAVISRFENHNRFSKIFKLIVELSVKSNDLRQVIREV